MADSQTSCAVIRQITRYNSVPVDTPGKQSQAELSCQSWPRCHCNKPKMTNQGEGLMTYTAERPPGGDPDVDTFLSSFFLTFPW